MILQQWLERNGYKMPVSFRNWRDVRTVQELAGWPLVRLTDWCGKWEKKEETK